MAEISPKKLVILQFHSANLQLAAGSPRSLIQTIDLQNIHTILKVHFNHKNQRYGSLIVSLNNLQPIHSTWCFSLQDSSLICNSLTQ